MKTLVKERVEGTYQIQVHTPMGVEEGTLKLSVEGESLNGTIINKKGITEFSGGTVDNGAIQFDTKIKTPMGRLKAQITGKVVDGIFSGIAKLPLGTAKIDGTKLD